MANEYEQLAAELELTDQPIPANEGRKPDMLLRKLDCAVIEHLHARVDRLARLQAAEAGALRPFDSARGLFSEGAPIYPGAGFRSRTHVQICDRNPNCILGYFPPRATSEGWPMP